MDIEEAKKIIDEDQKTRIKAFTEEYNELCKKYGFQITARAEMGFAPYVDNGGIQK